MSLNSDTVRRKQDFEHFTQKIYADLILYIYKIYEKLYLINGYSEMLP